MKFAVELNWNVTLKLLLNSEHLPLPFGRTLLEAKQATGIARFYYWMSEQILYQMLLGTAMYL